MTQHTREPWELVESKRESLFYLYQKGGCQIAKIDFSKTYIPVLEKKANAARIVACVNGCEGINPEAVKELLEALKLAEAHLDFCGWGDEYEREGARSHKLPGIIATAIAKAEGP